MSILIGMAVYDTVENDRTKFTKATLESLYNTVDLRKHKLYIIDNNSCKVTKDVIALFKNKVSNNHKGKVEIITLQENIGTARAINLAWEKRIPGQHCIKMDNDVVTEYEGWVDELEFCVERDLSIGQIGLKRKDLLETPYNEEGWYKSELEMLKHNVGEKWYLLEKCFHIMGTCVLHNSRLLDKVGYLYQPGLYGYDDALMSCRSTLAGYKNVFLPHIEIDHIDTGENLYTKIKIQMADASWLDYCKIRDEYQNGTRPLYQNIY